jgi:AraC-like DNA-binding protein
MSNEKTLARAFQAETGLAYQTTINILRSEAVCERILELKVQRGLKWKEAARLALDEYRVREADRIAKQVSRRLDR